MKKTLLFIPFLLLAFATLAQAGSKSERIEALKVSYITTEVGLSPEQAQAFWPLYNERESKIQAIRKEARKNRVKDPEKASEKELLKMIAAEHSAEQEMLNLKMEYHDKFLTILDGKQVYKLFQAEREFKRKLLQEMKRGREGPRGRR